MYYQTIIEQVLEEEQHTIATDTTIRGKKKGELASDVIRCIEHDKGGRFLEWIDNLDEYSSASDDNYDTTSSSSTAHTSGNTSTKKTASNVKNKNPIVSCWIQIHDYDEIRTKITASFKRYRLRREAGTIVPVGTDEGGSAAASAAISTTTREVSADALFTTAAAAVEPRNVGISLSTTTTQIMTPSLSSRRGNNFYSGNNDNNTSRNYDNGAKTTSGFLRRRGHSVFSGENNSNSNINKANNFSSSNDDTTFMFMNKRQKYSNDKSNASGCFGNYFQ